MNKAEALAQYIIQALPIRQAYYTSTLLEDSAWEEYLLDIHILELKYIMPYVES